ANIIASHSNNVGKGEVINIGSGNNLSINSVAKMISKEFEYQKPLKEPFANLACIEKAKKLLGWEPKMKLESWIREYING
ncbi:MAG: LPS biosynthesis protein WbpP, partial [Candidatus Marinimicrobia bacterium]|nr:LPS biosynthesis protein WbpP [Candidatus Neomarinimicrobiota bacterium]